MKKILYPEKSQLPSLARRPVQSGEELERQIRPIVESVAKEGDKALIRYTELFDNAKLSSLRVDASVLKRRDLVDNILATALEVAANNIARFHEAQKIAFEKVETTPGIFCWQKNLPIEKVGLYIPGGSAALFSSLLMLGIPAKIAGCREIIICTPPNSDGDIAKSIAYVANQLELEHVFRVGGAQAIAAMALGTETIPKVDKIFGPGNQYVSAAKQYVSSALSTAIDLPAGPTEVLVIADESADPEFIAADLLSQAEHGSDSQVVLVSISEFLVEKVLEEIENQLIDLDRRDIARKSLAESFCVVVHSIEDAIDFSNLYAPEHLVLSISNAAIAADMITCAGSVFIGHYTPESLGDYASGTNHTLPTNGAAKCYSGVSIDSFYKRITFQESSQEGLSAIADTVTAMARAEGLGGHASAVTRRVNKG